MKDDLIYLLGFKDAKYIAEKELEKNPCAANAQKVFEYSKRIDEVLVNIEKDYNELKKYKDLEEQLGCPLEVIAKLRKANYIYRDDGLEFGFIGINFNDEDKLILYDDDELNPFTSDLRLGDYKKKFWLKKDKSE